MGCVEERSMNELGYSTHSPNSRISLDSQVRGNHRKSHSPHLPLAKRPGAVSLFSRFGKVSSSSGHGAAPLLCCSTFYMFASSDVNCSELGAT